MSEQTVQDLLYNRETWKQYKRALLGGTLNTLHHHHQISSPGKTMVSSRFQLKKSYSRVLSSFLNEERLTIIKESNNSFDNLYSIYRNI